MNAEVQHHSDVIDGLALALVRSSTVPVLLLNDRMVVLAASQSFCSAFQIEPQNVADHELSELGRGEWDMPQLRSLMRATTSGHAIDSYEMDLKRKDRDPRRLRLNAVKLDQGESRDVRVLLTVSDITETLAAEALHHSLALEKTVLLREVQHRVANSLQIIASVLLQTARKVQSEETRTHLNDAHHRVLSIAAVQRQLAGSNSDQVDMRAYFELLCHSLGDSMIFDHNKISLEVDVDGSVRNADDSMALGLIVTELVINALKHAFPRDGHGRIVVHYRSHDEDWSLSVSDNGSGLRSATSKAGLGTSIVEALTRQLRARSAVSSSGAGTAVSITHTKGLAMVASAAL